DLASALRLNPSYLGFVLPPEACSGAGPRTELIARVKQGVEAGRLHHVPFFVEGKLAPDLAQRLQGVGADLLASPLIWPWRNDPASAERWPAHKIAELGVINAA